ncbi:DUF1269 domain-containing protein [Paraburkholderia fungorum]|jgi:uncharacterized membrane protein|uniref:DUF1269 domain-containing protein n=1 Tax=Paraburkholderia fungorum TaxID=134537 RepID=UPI000DB8C9C4|nr:DUF1269 domain-containing protein [Paraburkholderia fungorum]PZR48103.1 MAG: hypothetical protein DI523_12310 [Paraburkholderia fungorum]QLD51768.1 hypothetical protein C9419_22470 [Paraburkholderia fungorum]
MTQQLIVAVFSNVTDAEKAAADFRTLEGEDANFKIDSGVMVQKDLAGKVSLLGTKTQPFWGVVIGAITGGLIGMLGGPSGTLLGFTIGASTGLAGVALVDILDHEFVDSVSGDFAPGSFAVILEAREATPEALDKVVAAHHGIVYRKPLGA